MNNGDLFIISLVSKASLEIWSSRLEYKLFLLSFLTDPIDGYTLTVYIQDTNNIILYYLFNM